MNTIEERRRQLFEVWADVQGYILEYNDLFIYESGATRCAWAGFNAALDAVVIELPRATIPVATIENDQYAMGANLMLRHCRKAIEAAGLGLKVNA